MLRIGLTQRVEVIQPHGETRDCLDQRWPAYLATLGFTAVPIPNCLTSLREFIEELRLDGFILTGGNDLQVVPDGVNVSLERDGTEIAILKLASQESLPVLGVC